jgi:hypothetical protein
MIRSRTPKATRRRFLRYRSAVLALTGVVGFSLLAMGCGSGRSPGSGVAQEITGTWQGTLHVAGDQRIVMKIEKTDTGRWKAVLYDADSRTPGRPAKAITVRGATLKWSLAAPPSRYEGKLSADGNSIRGTWTGSELNGRRTSPLDFKRVTKATAWPIGVGGRVQPPNLRARNPIPQSADNAILAAFDKHEIVGLGMFYGIKDLENFVLDLLRNPALPGKVNDIAVECGSSLYQPLLDRYITGANVSRSEVQKVWRNTTQYLNCGLSAFWEQLFPLVRRINQTLPPAKKLRVLACDLPVDWSRVKSAKDLTSFMKRDARDAHIASIIERDVLAKHRHALMIFGAYHLMHREGDAVGMYERNGYPNATFTIVPHHGFGNDTPLAKYNDELEARMASWPEPSLVTLKDTWLGNLDSAYVFPDLDEPAPISALVDAYLYLGPRDLLLGEPTPASILADKKYVAALRRRAAIVGRWQLKAALQDATTSGVFFYEPSARVPGRTRQPAAAPRRQTRRG